MRETDQENVQSNLIPIFTTLALYFKQILSNRVGGRDERILNNCLEVTNIHTLDFVGFTDSPDDLLQVLICKLELILSILKVSRYISR